MERANLSPLSLLELLQIGFVISHCGISIIWDCQILDLGSKIDTSNLQQPLVASFQPPPWPQKHIHENRGIEDLAT